MAEEIAPATSSNNSSSHQQMECSPLCILGERKLKQYLSQQRPPLFCQIWKCYFLPGVLQSILVHSFVMVQGSAETAFTLSDASSNREYYFTGAVSQDLMIYAMLSQTPCASTVSCFKLWAAFQD